MTDAQPQTCSHSRCATAVSLWTDLEHLPPGVASDSSLERSSDSGPTWRVWPALLHV